jgi:ribosomal protein L37AE/L43A
MGWMQTVQNLDFDKAAEIFKNIEKAIEQSRRLDSDFIRSNHIDSCPKCGSHPVNHIKNKKTLCRKCGISFISNTIRPEHKNFYQGSTMLQL